MENKKYLIYSIEDDPNISRIINIALSKQGYRILSFLDYKSFAMAFNKEVPDMILLDLMLPDKSGEDILKEIRSNKNYDHIQIIIISAKNLLINKIDGLDLGADDYITKPFDVLELISRVNARVRRSNKTNSNKTRNLYYDFDARTLYKNNEIVKLTKGEDKIVEALFLNIGKAVSRDDLFVALWGKDANYETRILDMHIKSIRKKIGKDDEDLIETIYSFGYRLKDE